eukprot:sb/3473750/
MGDWASKGVTNQNSLFKSRDWSSANQGPVFPPFFPQEVMISGDSVGTIIEWSGGGSEWVQVEKLQPPEMKGVPISVLILHPNKRRIFAQSRDGTIRMFDLRIRAITQSVRVDRRNWLVGTSKQPIRTRYLGHVTGLVISQSGTSIS